MKHLIALGLIAAALAGCDNIVSDAGATYVDTGRFVSVDGRRYPVQQIARDPSDPARTLSALNDLVVVIDFIRYTCADGDCDATVREVLKRQHDRANRALALGPSRGSGE